MHPHTLALDGVMFVRGADGHLVFHSLAEPSAEQVAEVARRTAKRVGRILQRHGRSLEGMFGSKAESEGESDCDDDSDTFADSQQALACCYGAATQGVTMFGERAGAPTQRMVRAQLRRPSEPAAKVAGFDVHAKVAFDGRDRERVERLCHAMSREAKSHERRLGRPPIAQDRLTELDDGRLRYTMKKPWSDGTVALVFEPLDLIARLCALIPPPGFHTVRYHGVLSSHASLRPEVVPEPPCQQLLPPPPCQLELLDLLPQRDVPRSRKPWAWLLRHVFLHDVTTCPKCDGTMRWLEVATTKDAIDRLLARHDLADAAPARRGARSPPAQLSLSLSCA